MTKYRGGERWCEENKGWQGEKTKKSESFRKRETIRNETSDRGGGSEASLIITDTLHYPLRNLHTDAFMRACVLARNDRRV